MTDSPRWCATCESWGWHHTDRHDEMATTCDGCSATTYDPKFCYHDRVLCPACVDESRCYDCRIEGMTATWRLM